MEALKSVVRFEADLYPELVAHLETISPKNRAERIRVLTLYGFILMQSGGMVQPARVIETPSEPEPVSTGTPPLTLATKNTVLQSIKAQMGK
jgi:hypothetical protein